MPPEPELLARELLEPELLFRVVPLFEPPERDELPLDRPRVVPREDPEFDELRSGEDVSDAPLDEPRCVVAAITLHLRFRIGHSRAAVAKGAASARASLPCYDIFITRLRRMFDLSMGRDY